MRIFPASSRAAHSIYFQHGIYEIPLPDMRQRRRK
jgi:hypothetical protein